MFDIKSLNKRYFEIKITVTDDEDQEHSVTLELEPPKLKTFIKITSLVKKADESVMEELKEALRILLNKNKTKYKVPDLILDNLEFDEILGILMEFFKWIGEVKNSKN